jgi:hypothetical protein
MIEIFPPFIGKIKYEKDVAHVECGSGKINIYFDGAKQLLKEANDIHTVEFEFQTKNISINKDTTIEEVIDIISPKLSKEEKTRIQEETDNRRMKLQELSDRDFDTMMQSLSEVEKTDLVSGETEVSEVLNFSKQIAKILANATNVMFTEETAKKVAYQLIKLGCVSIDSINYKYLYPNTDTSAAELSQRKDKINLPAIVWTRILKTDPVTTNHAIGNLGGLLDSWSNDHITQNEETPNQ